MTKYRLAQDSSDMRMAYKLLKKMGFTFEQRKLHFPVVLAFNDGKIVGAFGTTIEDDMIIAGPMAVLNDRPRHTTALKLYDLYDIAMYNLGVESYILATEIGSTANKAAEMVGAVPYAVKGNMEYAIRRLNNGWRRHDSRGPEADSRGEGAPARSG